MGSFLFKEMILEKKGNLYLQKQTPRISLSYEIKEPYLVLIATASLEDYNFKEPAIKTIDTGSLNEIYNLLCRKIENFTQINKMTKRDNRALYSFSDFIRGRLGEMYAELGVRKLVKSLPYYLPVSLESYRVAVVEEERYNKHRLTKKINAMNHGNYCLYHHEVLKGEFDFALQIEYKHKSTRKKTERALIIGESKTGNLHLRKRILKDNLLSLSKFPYNHIIYCLVFPYERYYNKNTISEHLSSLYNDVIERVNKKLSKRKIHLMPVVFYNEGGYASIFFKKIADKVSSLLSDLFKKKNLETFLKISPEGEAYSPNNPIFMIKVPSNVVIKDARKISEKRFKEKYGGEIYILLKD